MPTHLVDLKNQVQGDVSICQTFAATTADHDGNYVDMQLSDGPIFGCIALGTVTGSGVTITAKLQECDTTNGTYTDMTSGGTFTVYTEDTADNVMEFVNARRTKRYVQANLVIAAATSVTSVPVSVTILGQKKILGGSGYYSE